MSAAIHYLFTPMTKPTQGMPNRIREHRNARGLSLQQLGDRVGIHKTLVGMIERGERPLTIDRQRAFARELGVGMTDLLAASDHPDAPTDDERQLLSLYRSLPAPARRTVTNLAENLQTWTAEPDADEGERRRA